MGKQDIDWLLLGRYALLITLATLIPIPILDRSIENFFRRRMVRAIASRHGATLPPAVVAKLADEPFGGCLGCLAAIVLWPVRKILRTVLVVWQAKALADTTSEVVHRGLMLEEAFGEGWLPADETTEVRTAMDRALHKVDTRPVERALMGTLRDQRDDLTAVVRDAVRVARQRAKGASPRAALADAADADGLGQDADQLSASIKASIQGVGLVPEVLYWFRAAMGAPPHVPAAIGGAVEVAEVLPADDAEAPPAIGTTAIAVVEDAVEVSDDPRDD
ncbi:MAG: hypothetical protein ACI8PZ_002948 [Myxococcota bacterium]